MTCKQQYVPELDTDDPTPEIIDLIPKMRKKPMSNRKFMRLLDKQMRRAGVR